VDYGPYDPKAALAQQFRNPVHCAQLSHDDLLYVCDRVNDRIQVFKPDGTFVKEKLIETKTLGSGSVWDIAFSNDQAQRFIYVADGENDKVHILDRNSLEVLTSFGDGGRQPGEFTAYTVLRPIQRAIFIRPRRTTGGVCRSSSIRALGLLRKSTRAWFGLLERSDFDEEDLDRFDSSYINGAGAEAESYLQSVFRDLYCE